MGRKLLCIVLAFVMLFSLTACTNKAESSKEASGDAAAAGSDAAKSPIRVAIVYSGNLGDKSYNDSCNAGAQRSAAEFGI